MHIHGTFLPNSLLQSDDLGYFIPGAAVKREKMHPYQRAALRIRAARAMRAKPVIAARGRYEAFQGDSSQLHGLGWWQAAVAAGTAVYQGHQQAQIAKTGLKAAKVAVKGSELDLEASKIAAQADAQKRADYMKMLIAASAAGIALVALAARRKK